MRWIGDRPTGEEARQDLAARLEEWRQRHQQLCDWAEANVGETLTLYRRPRRRHKNLKSTNLPERVNEEFRLRTLAVRGLPSTASRLRLVRARAVEMREIRIGAIR